MAKKDDFTTRTLMAMATELAEHLETGERLRIQFEALAAAHGVAVQFPVDKSSQTSLSS